MKQFNLEQAKAGASVCTRNGRDVRIICFDREAEFPIVALIRQEDDNSEIIAAYPATGQWNLNREKHKYDLLMKSAEIDSDDYRAIKTYKDACRYLEEDEYLTATDYIELPSHIIALIKLETIARALRRDVDIDSATHYWKPKVGNLNGKINVCAIDADHESRRLAVDSSEKAIYFGEQFIDLWADYLSV